MLLLPAWASDPLAGFSFPWLKYLTLGVRILRQQLFRPIRKRLQRSSMGMGILGLERPNTHQGGLTFSVLSSKASKRRVSLCRKFNYPQCPWFFRVDYYLCDTTRPGQLKTFALNYRNQCGRSAVVNRNSIQSLRCRRFLAQVADER
jgi:hypothetical protein